MYSTIASISSGAAPTARIPFSIFAGPMYSGPSGLARKPRIHARQSVASGAALFPDLSRAVHRIVAEHVAVGGDALERQPPRRLAAHLLLGAALGVRRIA